MKTLPLLWPLALLAMTPAHAADEPDAATLQKPGFHLGVIDTWRSTPVDVVKWCASADPERAAARDRLLDDWSKAHAALASRVDQEIADVAHLALPPRPGLDVVQGLKAQMTMARMQQQFLGRSKEDTLALCTRVSQAGDVLWSDANLPKVEASLGFLDAWRAKQSAGK